MTASDFEPGGLADWVAQETPIGRWSNPEEIADLTEFFSIRQSKLHARRNHQNRRRLEFEVVIGYLRAW